MKQQNRSGFILYIVMAVLLGLAILAFALNSFKQGAVTQLSRNVDQNRLALLAQSANAEVMAMIRSQVNDNPTSQIFQKFRGIFPETGGGIALHQDVVLFSNFEPQQTLKLAQTAGYPLKIKSKAVLRVFRKAPFASVSAFNGFLDVFSQAYREGSQDIPVEAHERRDVRLVDLRHSLDKYALFVKNYCYDLNNSSRRLMVNGIPVSGNDISRIYLGTGLYPPNRDTSKGIYLDLFYEQHREMPGFRELFGFSGLKEFPHGADDSTVVGTDKIPRLFYANKLDFASLSGISTDLFIKVPTLMHIYEKFVNSAADSCLKPGTEPFAVQDALKAKCKRGIDKLKNDQSYAQQICQDFYANANGDDYSNCAEFKKILRTCEEEWKYHYGYTDAVGVWNVDQAVRPMLPPPHKWVTALYYRGLVDKTPPFDSEGPFFKEYLERQGGVEFNQARVNVGKMARIYGEDNKTPVLVEGPAFMRFFKIGYLSDFKRTVQFLIPQEIQPEPVPILFRRPDRAVTFQNRSMGLNLAPSGFFEDKMMMSKAFDSLSVNALLGRTVSFYDGDGNPVTIDPMTAVHPTFAEAARPSGSTAKASERGRLIDSRTVSHNYPSSKDFYRERVAGSPGNKVLYIDGVMYIENGDLDLSDVKHFYGKGMIYLGTGNCLLGNFTRQRDPVDTGDSLRICLRQGDFIIKSSEEDVVIEASLIALFFPFNGTDQKSMGSLILNGRKNVTVAGNLLVDYLYTYDAGGAGLKENGTLSIFHDPLIYNPAATIDGKDMDPYHVSIGSVKTIFAINAGGKTF